MVKKKWMQAASSEMQKKGTVGAFTARAKKAGMSTQAYARKIMQAKKGVYSSLLRKRANFALNANK